VGKPLRQVHLSTSLPVSTFLADPPPGNGLVRGKRGSALLATLCFAGVLSLSVAGYLAVCYRSLVVSNREINYSHSVELAEIGMDEALWAMNNNSALSDWTTTGWTVVGSTASKTLIDPITLAPFSYDNGATGQVTITITGSLSIKTNTQINSVGAVTLVDHTVIKRGLTAASRVAQLFTNALGGTGSVAFTAGGTVDSYSAVNPLDIATYTYGYSAVVFGGTLDVANASIFGFAATQASALQSQSSAKVTGTSSGTGIDPTRVSSSGTQPIFDTTSPSFTDRFDPISGLSQLTNSDTLSTPGNYSYDSILLDGSSVLTIDAPVVLKVTNYVYVGLGSQIHVTTNGSLVLQVASTSYDSAEPRVANASHLPQGLYLAGGGIINDSQLPQKVTVEVAGTVATDTSPHSYSYFDTSVPFYGSIYLPNDKVDVVSNDFTLYGAMIAKNITFSGTSPVIHFDPTLRDAAVAGVNQPYALYQLRELTRTEIGP